MSTDYKSLSLNLMIVRRGCTDTYQTLNEMFEAKRPVTVIWDRRFVDRRQTSADYLPGERRCENRRKAPTPDWRTRDFILVRVPGVSDTPTGPSNA